MSFQIEQSVVSYKKVLVKVTDHVLDLPHWMFIDKKCCLCNMDVIKERREGMYFEGGVILNIGGIDHKRYAHRECWDLEVAKKLEPNKNGKQE